MKQCLFIILLLLPFTSVKNQPLKFFAGSIRQQYKIPGMAYAVLSPDSIFEIQSVRVQHINNSYKMKIADRAYVIFTNSYAAEKSDGIAVLPEEMMHRYRTDFT